MLPGIKLNTIAKYGMYEADIYMTRLVFLMGVEHSKTEMVHTTWQSRMGDGNSGNSF